MNFGKSEAQNTYGTKSKIDRALITASSLDYVDLKNSMFPDKQGL